MGISAMEVYVDFMHTHSIIIWSGGWVSGPWGDIHLPLYKTLYTSHIQLTAMPRPLQALENLSRNVAELALSSPSFRIHS